MPSRENQPVSAKPLSRRTIAIAAAVAAVLCLPALWVGFFADDWAHLMAMEGLSVGGSEPYDLYRFTHPEQGAAAIRNGPWPWWTVPTLNAAFWRPIPSALFALDHALFGLEPLGYHAHSILWYLVLVATVGAFYRRVFVHPAAKLALFMFAVDEAHAFATGWIASRYANVTAVFAVVAVLAYWRYRRHRWRPGLPVALVALGIALACGESALAAFGYFVGYELVVSKDAIRRRVASIAPLFLLAFVYLGFHRALGYGVTDSGLYFNPVTDPIGYAAVVPARLPALLGSLVSSTPIDAWMLVPETHVPLIVVGVIVTVVFGVLLRSKLRAADETERVTLSWLTVGALLGAFVGLGAGLGTRLLIVSSVGAFPVIAAVVLHTRQRWRQARGRARVPLAVATVWLVAVHLLVAAPLFSLNFVLMRMPASRSDRVMAALELDDPDGKIAIVRTSDVFSGLYGSGPLKTRRGFDLEAFNLLTLTTHPMAIVGTANGFEVQLLEWALLESEFERVFRSKEQALVASDVVETSCFSVRVLEVEHGKPTRLEVFDIDGQAQWLLDTGNGFEKFVIPRAGERVVLPRARSPVEF